MNLPENPKVKKMEENPPARGTSTPGWNDPPRLMFDPSKPPSLVGGTPGRLKLNKRVAFPLEKGTAPVSQPIHSVPVAAPPPVTGSAEISNKHCQTDRISDEPVVLSEEVVSKVMGSMLSCLTCCKFEKIQEEDLKRRLLLIKETWEDGKLSEEVKKYVFRLSEALTTRHIEEADKLHKHLVVNCFSECSVWIPAIRHIIHKLSDPVESSNDDEKS